MVINVLSSEIVNQIAAGEVIENPSAVIKELVENSIDAGASQIDVEIENSGVKKIVVKDNGSGISKEDLLKAPVRHATSKILNFNDLYDINTMGFRGEALASIFSVSEAKIVSRLQGSDESYEISSKNVSRVYESAGQSGTGIFIKNLFYNTPARKKYLKSLNLELKAIVDVMMRFCVFYSSIKFTLKHNGKFLINKPCFDRKEDNLYYVLGKELKGNVLYFEDEIDGLKVSGFLGKPSNISYSFRKNQYVYVNSRFVKSKIVRDAVYEGFGTNLMGGRHPFFVLFVDVDPEVVDVNVHPTKIEVRFENELEIFKFVKYAVRKVFEEQETIKPFNEGRIEEVVERDFSLSEKIDDLKDVSNMIEKKKVKPESKSYFSKDVQKPLEVRETVCENCGSCESSDLGSEGREFQVENVFSRDDTEIIGKNEEKIESVLEDGPLGEVLEEYRIVGQVNKTYVIVETKKEMLLIDQHAAEEKCFFEMFVGQLESSGVKVQMLLKPEIVNLSSSEMLLYKENKELIEKLGVRSEEFGESEVIVRGVPLGIRGEVMSAQILKDILHEVTVDKKFKTLEVDKVEKLASKACRRSIKAGHEMTMPEIHNLIERLKKLKEPFNCPHGRPSMLRYSFKDLEKKFKRIV